VEDVAFVENTKRSVELVGLRTPWEHLANQGARRRGVEEMMERGPSLGIVPRKLLMGCAQMGELC